MFATGISVVLHFYWKHKADMLRNAEKATMAAARVTLSGGSKAKLHVSKAIHALQEHAGHKCRNSSATRKMRPVLQRVLARRHSDSLADAVHVVDDEHVVLGQTSTDDLGALRRLLFALEVANEIHNVQRMMAAAFRQTKASLAASFVVALCIS